LRTELRRRIWRPQRTLLDAGGNLLEEKFDNLYLLPGTRHLMKVKSLTIRWTDLVARIREVRNAYTILVGKPYGKGDVDGRMTSAGCLEE
jgi:hypothetical protein